MKPLKMTCAGIPVALLVAMVSGAEGRPAGKSGSQTDSRVVPGVRVRVTVPKELYWSLSDYRSRLVGNVESMSDGTLMLGYKDRVTPLEIPFESVSRVEISRGSGPSPLKPAGIGFLVGLGLGAAIGLAGGDDEGGFISFSAEEKAVGLGIGLGVIGFVIGLIGGLLNSGERWEAVPNPFSGAELAMSPQRSGMSLALSQRF